MKIKIPKNELLWVTCYDEKHVVKFIIVSDKIRTVYFLYSVDENGNINKIKQSQNPLKFNDYIEEQLKKEK